MMLPTLGALASGRCHHVSMAAQGALCGTWDVDPDQQGQCHSGPLSSARSPLAAVAPQPPQGTAGPQGHSQHMGAPGPRHVEASGAVTSVRDGLRALAGSNTWTPQMWRQPPLFRAPMNEMQVPAVPFTVSPIGFEPQRQLSPPRCRKGHFSPWGPGRSERVPGKPQALAGSSAAPQALGAPAAQGQPGNSGQRRPMEELECGQRTVGWLPRGRGGTQQSWPGAPGSNALGGPSRQVNCPLQRQRCTCQHPWGGSGGTGTEQDARVAAPAAPRTPSWGSAGAEGLTSPPRAEILVPKQKTFTHDPGHPNDKPHREPNRATLMWCRISPMLLSSFLSPTPKPSGSSRMGPWITSHPPSTATSAASRAPHSRQQPQRRCSGISQSLLLQRKKEKGSRDQWG